MVTIINAAEVKQYRPTIMLYGAPGSGKTTALGKLPGRKLIIDADRGTSVLMGDKSVDVCSVVPESGDIWEVLKQLKDKCPYDYVCIDSLSEIERGLLAYLGRTGKNGGAPERAHYNQVQFKLADLCRQFRMLPASIVFTCWEDIKDVVDVSGEKFARYQPMMSGKTAEVVCGLCDIVGKIATNKEGQRFVLLENSNSVVAKDRIWKRKACAVDAVIPTANKEGEKK